MRHPMDKDQNEQFADFFGVCRSRRQGTQCLDPQVRQKWVLIVALRIIFIYNVLIPQLLVFHLGL